MIFATVATFSSCILLINALMGTHTHTHTHTQTHTNTHTQTHKQTNKHGRTNRRSHTHTHRQTYTHAHTRAHTLTHTHTHMYTHTHSYRDGHLGCSTRGVCVCMCACVCVCVCVCVCGTLLLQCCCTAVTLISHCRHHPSRPSSSPSPQEEQRAYDSRRFAFPAMGWIQIMFFSGKGTVLENSGYDVCE
jgi:Flp pilus assembly protein TadB